MSKTDLTIARACLQAYVNKDRAAIEALIVDDFHFTSPIDNALNRTTYFARCWPNSEVIVRFDDIHEVGWDLPHKAPEGGYVENEGPGKSQKGGSESKDPLKRYLTGGMCPNTTFAARGDRGFVRQSLQAA